MKLKHVIFNFHLHKSTGFVFEYLTDMQKFGSAHPVIFQVDDYGDSQYLIHEKLKFGFLSLSFRYLATVQKDAIKNQVTFTTTVMKLVKLKIKFVLIPDGDSTIVEERIAFKSILPLKVLKAVFEKHHTQLFKNIEAL